MPDADSDSEYHRLEAELAALHREWHRDQERFLVRGKDGQLHEPTAGARIGLAIALMVGGVIFMALLAASPLPWFAGYLGLIPFAIGTHRLMASSAIVEAYERTRTAYETRRQQLLTQLGTIQKNGEPPA